MSLNATGMRLANPSGGSHSTAASTTNKLRLTRDMAQYEHFDFLEEQQKKFEIHMRDKKVKEQLRKNER